jgi:Ca2+-binding EF-hand superfamily protein
LFTPSFFLSFPVRLGFPENLCSEVELHDVAALSSHKTPGSLTYGEFLAFCTGHDALTLAPSAAGSGGAGANDGSVKNPPPPPGPLDSPSLLNALSKINNTNLRKMFKECDTDNDGLITTAQLAKGLVDHGNMHPTLATDPAFVAYVESYSQRKPGHFGYAEFLKFVNTRVLGNTAHISGQPLLLHASAATRIPEDQSPSAMLETIVKALRSSNVSVESMLSQFDCDFDGMIDEAEFYMGISSLGFTLSPAQSKTFFDALDNTKSGTIDVHEFANLIVNPSKHVSSSQALTNTNTLVWWHACVLRGSFSCSYFVSLSLALLLCVPPTAEAFHPRAPSPRRHLDRSFGQLRSRGGTCSSRHGSRRRAHGPCGVGARTEPDAPHGRGTGRQHTPRGTQVQAA